MNGRLQSHEFPITESGDAEFFAEHYGNKVKYDHRRGRWLIFEGHRWQPEATGLLHRLAIAAMRRRQDQASIITWDNDQRRAHYKWTLAGESRTRLENMLALAKNVEPISDSGDNWDADPWLLCCLNGVLDIRTCTLRDGTAEDRITQQVRANYDPDAACPDWEEMIANVFGNDCELMLYVQSALGYSLTGVTREQCLFLNSGGGGNGKGTLINTIAWLMNDYAVELPFASLEKQMNGAIPNDIATLDGKRFITASESKKGIAWDDARLKQLTGCDNIRARFLYHEFFTFTPVGKFWLSCNDKPQVDDNSDGFWRRMRVIPWSQQFMGARNDKGLKERLKDEADGILAWMVRGCHEGWRALKLLEEDNAPKAVLEATREYKSESDALAPFIDTRLVLVGQGRVGGAQLRTTYLDWCERTDTRALSAKYFGIWAKKQFKHEESHHVTTYLGISIRPI